MRSLMTGAIVTESFAWDVFRELDPSNLIEKPRLGRQRSVEGTIQPPHP